MYWPAKYGNALIGSTIKGFGGYVGKTYAPDALAYAMRGINYLRGLVNAEMYKLDVIETGTIITDNPVTYVQHLTPVAQGDGDSNRTGNSIFVRSLNIRGQVIHNSSGTSPEFTRVVVVMDTQQVGDTSPTLGLVLEANGYNSHLNKATVGRFKILYSQIIETDSVNRVSRNFYINLPMRHHVRYNGTASTDIQKGGIYLMAVSSEPTNGPKLVFDSRLSYRDN